ncbi:aminotransferase class I/II-fold pyridoxal phosphate-dependent enzyme [Couchioplanes caeruleus]|uniref:MalY/PatB family protein n=1 Tax=Couchioplanes caeruleus TaxID=56438 RepID=UPI00201C1ABB|nr:aminotransferase class I/II-fold pyridoxal phosphate-dependent enzyme [Couchioplanes caeruleus]UQU62946.1 aminotransferase class I/II-fold pyridoxal phosphate-dependent enzyme [Couchioplanes caeruleus]
MKVDPLETLRGRCSAKWRTHPADVLPLFVAEMDVPLAPVVADALRAAVDASDTGYSAPVPDLGRAVAGFAARRWGWEIDPARVTAVTDVGVGVVELLRVLTRPGDAVVISPPVYPPFFHWAPEAGAQLREVPLTADLRLDLAALEVAFAAHPAVYLLCNPHNPVGRAHSREELSALVTLASRYGVTVVSDEIHAPLVLPGATFTPFLSLPGAADVGVSVVSASKAFNLAGLKCAAVVDGTRPLASSFPPDVRWRTGHLGVLATVAAFTDGDEWLDELLTFLAERRAQLGELLRTRLPWVRWQPPEATFLAWLDCRAREEGEQPAARFLERGRVALEPGLRFGAAGAGHVRLNFGTSPEILEEATARMARAAG